MTPRVYIGGAAASPVAGVPLALPDAVARHVTLSLRMRQGDALTLFTGAGGEWPSTIASLSRHEVTVVPQRHDPVERESGRDVTLVQGLIAADAMDFVVRKAVELGAAAIVPLVAARSQAPDRDRLLRRHGHWEQIAIAACEQCGRNRIPAIAAPIRWDDWITRGFTPGVAPVFVERAAAASLAAVHVATAVDTVVVGPEGGFAPSEIDAATSLGARVAHLGSRVLRAETAALAALALVLLGGR